jgi:predicted nucleic acid-binding protein
MTAVFADTSYWIALTNVQDAGHETAKAVSISINPRTIVTTEPVLIEYLNYFGGWGPHFRRTAAASVRAMTASRTVRILGNTGQLFLAGLEFYAARPDKG